MNNKIVISILLFFLTCSAAIYIYAPRDGHNEVDTIEYQTVADAFITHKSFFDPRQATGMPLHPIGYSMVLGIAGLISHDPLILVVLLQIIATMCAIYLLMGSTQLITGSNGVSYIAGITAALNVGYLTYCQILLTESLLLFCVTLFAYLFINYLKTSNPAYLLFSGTILGISVLIKPNALFLPLLLSGVIVLKSKDNLKQARDHLLLFIWAYASPLISYTVYNFYMFDVLTLTGTMHENMYYYFLPRHVFPLLTKTESIEIQQLIDKELFTHNGLPLILNVFIKHPIITAQAWLSNVFKTIFGLYATQFKVLFNPLIRGGVCSFFKMEGQGLQKFLNYIFFGSSGTYTALAALVESALVPAQLLLAASGLTALYVQKKFNELAFLLSYLIYFIGITGHDGCSRYRLPAEPVLIISAAIGMYAIYQLICKKKDEELDLQQSSPIHNSGDFDG